MDNEIEDFDTFFNRYTKSDSSDGGVAVSDKEAPKKKDDKDSFEAFFQERTGTPLTSPSRQDLNLTGSEYKPVESTTIGSGVLGSGNFIKPAPPAHESEVDKIANVPYSDQQARGFSTEILRAYSDPKTLKEIEEKVKWYVPTDEQLRVLQTHDREKTTKQALSELGGAAWEAFTQGPGLVGDMLQGAYGIGKGLTTGVLAATHAPIINKFGDQAAKDRVNQSIDEGIRSGRVLADAALSTGEAILEPIQRMSKGGSSWADSILDKSEEERFQNYKNRYISRVADYEAKEINPAVLARFTNWISNQNFYVPPEDIGYADPIRPEEMKAMSGPLVRELGAGLISSLTPSVEERLARHNGDRQAAAIEKQTEDMAASNSMIDAAIANANRLAEDPSQVGFVGLVTPFNEFAAAGMLAKGANVGIRAGIQGARELGKTAEEINKLRSLQAAKAMEKAGTAAQALEKAGYLEQALEGTAKGIEYVGDTSQKLFNLVPEGIRPIAKQGAALAGLTGVGAGLGALSDDEAAGAGLGVGAYIGSKLPGVSSDLLKARRLAAGKIGMFETASMLPNEMRAATTRLAKFAGPKGDFWVNNAKDFLKSNIDMAPLAVALGVYNDEDIKGIGRTIVEGGFLAGAHQLWGKAMGKDPIALERQNKARNLAAEKALIAASPEHRSNIDNLNWDRVVEQRETAAKKLARDHAIAAAENPDSPDAQRLFEQKETANRMYREAMGASVETRKRFAEEMRAYFGDAEAHINGVLSPGSNTKIELLTTDQIKDRFTTSGGQAPTASDLFPFTDSEGISISGGRPVDRPWFGNLKDQIIINYDKLVANTRLTGDALPTALSHEVGHDLWRRKEYRTLMMPSYIELFGNEVQDEQGNVVAGKAGMYNDDVLFSMYGEKYLSKYKNDPEAVKQFAIASGLWDYENNTINRKSAIQYMKEELLADAYTSNIDLPPDSPMRAGLKWVESKITNESLKRVLRALNSMGVDPFVGEATGAVYTPEVRNMVREAQRLIEKHNGLFEDVDPENPDPQPVITKKDILASKDLLQKYHSDSGKFVTTPSLVVIDADGTVIGQRPITTPNVFEGQWDYVVDENGEIKPVRKRGYGPLPPEAEGMNIPEGATIRIQREIAYGKDGKPIEKSNSQTRDDILERNEAIRAAIVGAADGTPGEVKPFTASGMSLRGKLTQKQRAAIMALPESIVPLSIKEKLFRVMDTIAKDDGSRLNTIYAARLNERGGYTPFAPEMRDFTPVSVTFSKDGNFLANTFSVSGLTRKLNLWKQHMPGKFAPWNGDMEAFNADFQKYLKNWEPIWEDADGNRRARPGQSDLDVNAEMAIAKKNVFNDLIGVSSEEFNPEVSELPRKRFTRAQKKRAKQSDPNTIFRSYRLDAMTDLIDSPVPEKYRIDYGLAKINFKPEGENKDIRVENVDPSSIPFKEKDQERERINAIKQAYGNDPSEIDWDTQPKPIVSIDSEGKMQVEDGHHRLSAFSELGYEDVPVIIVPKDEWDALEKENGLSGAGIAVAEQVGDEYTAGQDSYQGSRKPSGTIESDTTILSSNPQATNATYVPPSAESSGVEAGQAQFMPDRPTRGININDKEQDFTGQILRGEKTIETRDQNRSLAPYVGKRVGIISTGKGPAMLRGLADIGDPIEYKTPEEFRAAQGLHQVTPYSPFDIKAGQSKFGYPLSNIEELPIPQPVPRSGRVASNIEGVKFKPENEQPAVEMPKTAQEEKQKVSIVIGAKAGEHGFSFTTVADLKDRVQKYEGQKAAIETVGELQDKKEKLMAMLKKAKPDKQAGYQTKIDALTKEIRQISKEIPEIIRRISPEKAAYKLRAKRIASMVNGLEMEATPAPFTAPTQGIRDMAELGDSVHDILLSEGFRNLSKDFFGVEGLEVEPISGTWKGKVEPSFVLSGPDLTFEKAAEITKVLSFAFAQDAGITYRPSLEATEGISAAYLIHGEQLSQDQLKLAFDKAIEVGVDISTTPDGLGIKALNFDVEDFASKIAEIQKAAAIDSVYNTLVDSDLYETKKDFSGSMGQRSQPVWLQASAAGQPLLQRSIDSLLVPYAKATAAQGYIFEPELFAKRFGLDGSVVEYINDRLYPTEIESRSASPLLDGREVLNVRSTYTAGGKRETAVPDMIHALQMRSAQNGVIQPGDYSERAGQIVSSVIADEVEQHMRRAALNPSAPNAIGWYDAALKRMKVKYSELFPFLKVGSPEYNADKSFVFDCVLGITSQGNDVFENGKMATRVCLMLEDGKSLSEIVKTLSETFGNQTRAIENNLLKLEALLAQNSPTELRDLMLQSDTVSNWNKRLKSSDNLFYQDAPLKVKGGSKQVVTGFMVFGPKIGSFINNLHGDYSTLTADLWYTRTWNRMLGRSFQYDPALEANQFDTFKEYLLEEYNRNEAKKNGVRYKDRVFESSSGTKTKFEYGKDAPDISRTEFEQLLNDDNAMLALADQLESEFRKGGYKIKSDLRRAAKNWTQGRKLPEAAPRTDLERTFQQKTMEAAQDKLRSMGYDISIADMQAALWYNEKELFQKYGAANSGAEPADYATAADFISQLIQAGALFQVDRKNKTVRLVPDSMEAKLTKVVDPDRGLMKRLLAEEKARKEAEKARKKAEGEEEEGDED